MHPLAAPVCTISFFLVQQQHTRLALTAATTARACRSPSVKKAQPRVVPPAAPEPTCTLIPAQRSLPRSHQPWMMEPGSCHGAGCSCLLCFGSLRHATCLPSTRLRTRALSCHLPAAVSRLQGLRLVSPSPPAPTLDASWTSAPSSSHTQPCHSAGGYSTRGRLGPYGPRKSIT